jgi:pyrroloquinoline quinone biosynthesis protein B
MCLPLRRTRTSPTSLSTRRCFDTDGCSMPSLTTSSPTGDSAAAKKSRISRRRGSATALKASEVVVARATKRNIYSDIGICQGRKRGKKNRDQPAADTLRLVRVKILGSAAGGGFPQWNCACPNCRALRAGTFPGRARSQAQVAVAEDSRSWFLLGASPDLRAQIEANPVLHPREGVRQSPISGAVVANADIDHVLGLLLLRELQPLHLYATASLRRILSEDNSMFAMLQRVPGQLTWSDFTPGTTFPLLNSANEDSGLQCRALSLGTRYPAYVSPSRQRELAPGEASLGLRLESPAGKRLVYMPAVPEINDRLLEEFDSTDVLLFDGTFWSDDELIRVQGSGKTARQMGHMPVSSEQGSLRRLAQLRRPRKIYMHVNNTNPMLNEAGREYRLVQDSGWEIAEDGWEFDL